MILKMIGLGLKMYLEVKSNIFDMVIVFMSTVDLGLLIYTKTELQKGIEINLKGIGTIMQVFRIFRLLRVFKLARSWKTFNFFLKTIGNTLVKISSFTILLMLFMFMYAMLGMELFANKLRFDRSNKPVNYYDPLNNNTSKHFSIPDSNFDSFLNAVLSVFIVIANDGWTVIYFDHYRTPAVGSTLSTIFFMSLVILGQMILFNLFLAILLKQFDENKITSGKD